MPDPWFQLEGSSLYSTQPVILHFYTPAHLDFPIYKQMKSIYTI